MRVRYTETALAEIDELLSYIARDNSRAASEVSAQIEKTVSRVADRPDSARVVRRDESGDIHAVMVGRFNYRIFYVVEAEELVVRNVRRTRRPTPWEQP